MFYKQMAGTSFLFAAFISVENLVIGLPRSPHKSSPWRIMCLHLFSAVEARATITY
ncbi:unnamed protein product [Rhodiola kirilowii]